MKEFYGPFSASLKKADEESERVKVEDEVTDVPCDKCGRMMVIKNGRFGKFLACPGYPECKNAKPLNEYAKNPCPVCGEKVAVRKSRAGKKFYICENNTGVGQGCSYISWNAPKEGEKWDPNSVKQMESKPEEKKATAKKSASKKTITKTRAKKNTTKIATTKKKKEE